MPKDKSESHIQIVEAMQEEFLTKGFENASMRNIAKKSDISAAGLYRHFSSKEAMFDAFAKPLIDKIYLWSNNHKNSKYKQIDKGYINRQSIFDESLIDLIENVIYPDKEAYYILFFKAQGTKYENFLDQFVNIQVKEMINLFGVLKEKGIDVDTPIEEELYMLISVYVKALLDPIAHLYPKEKMKHYLKTVEEFFLPGWINIMKI